MPALTAQVAAGLLGDARLTGDPSLPLGEAIIDSRAAGPGTTFWALPGTRTDGHQFVAAALAAGAAGAVVSRAIADRPAGKKHFLLTVPDTAAALRRLGAAWRARFDLPVWAITGSNGKTGTREMLAWLLRRHLPVHATGGNRNNDLGVPLTLLGLRDEHRALVIELGMNHPGELATLAAWARPTGAIITNVAASHLEYFGTLEAIAEAKAELAAALPAGAPLVVNADDPRVRGIADRFPRLRRVTFGLDAPADFRATGLAPTPSGTDFTVNGRRVGIPFPGRHQVLNAAAAIAALATAGYPLPTGDLFTGVRLEGRMEWQEWHGVRVLVDCYNANPFSTRALLETLPAVSEGRRVIVVLGEMLELGADGPALHREAGACAAGVAAVLITVGELARAAAGAARAAGQAEVIECRDAKEAGAVLRELARPGDLVALKASHGVRLERALEGWQRQGQ